MKKIKILIFCTSLILSLASLEIGLRFAGYFLSHVNNPGSLGSYETDNHYEVSGNKVDNDILCIGDSFTNGGNVIKDWKGNYPFHLGQLFSKESKRFNTLNMGLCEDTTQGVFERLKMYLQSSDKSHKVPKYVVVLAGTADGFHTKHTKSLDTVQWIEPNQVLDAYNNYWFYNLRTYKMFRHIKSVLYHKYLLHFTKLTATNQTWKYADDYYLYASKLQYKEANRVLSESIEFIKKTIPYNNRLSKDYILYRDMTEPIIVNVVNANLVNGRYDEALSGLLLIAKELPQVWGVYGMRFLTFQTFRKQTRHSAEVILNLIEKDKEMLKVPEVSVFFNNFKNFFTSELAIKERQEKYILEMLELSKKYGFSLILQNYPSDYRPVNDAINEISEKYGIPLVDNRSIFKELIENEGRSKYLMGDEHCTDLGYQIMAQNVKRTIDLLENK